MKLRLSLAVTLGVLLITITSTWAANRFNVFSYADHWDTKNKGQFYQWLKDLKLSGFKTFVPDSAGYYLVDSLGDSVALYAQHWREQEAIDISEDNSFKLYDASLNTHFGKMRPGGLGVGCSTACGGIS